MVMRLHCAVSVSLQRGYHAPMPMTVAAWAIALGVFGVVCVGLRRLFTRGPAEYDAGAVSQSWLTDHKADREPLS
jgi:hypothetical protein